MSRRALPETLLLAVALLLTACHGVPSGVIQPEEMALLMADVHTGEAVVDMNRGTYVTDSAKQAFKQSVYARHGVTSAQVDSSLAWYGRNITRYMEVYDRTIEILEHRLTEMGNRVAAEAAMSVSGDSVDVWPYPRHIAVSRLSPTSILSFGFNADENWEAGDVYTLRAIFVNNGQQSEWQMAMEYSDGAVETVYSGVSGDGWRELTLRADSAKALRRLVGYIRPEVPALGTVRLDSIALVRKRLDQNRYNDRYRQRRVRHYSLPDSLESDTRQ